MKNDSTHYKIWSNLALKNLIIIIDTSFVIIIGAYNTICNSHSLNWWIIDIVQLDDEKLAQN